MAQLLGGVDKFRNAAGAFYRAPQGLEQKLRGFVHAALHGSCLPPIVV
jgi:hypothetical protein